MPKQEIYDKLAEPPKPTPADAQQAVAWIRVYDLLVKHNPKVGKTKGPAIDAAVAEIERLQAIDRTLERRLKAK